MGIYLNPGAGQFLMARSSKIYVDKTMLLRELDEVFGTEQRFVCVSRPRRFGKTMAANMVCAYYDRREEAVFIPNCIVIDDCQYPILSLDEVSQRIADIIEEHIGGAVTG